MLKKLLGGGLALLGFIALIASFQKPLSEGEVLSKARGAVVKVELLYARGGGTGFFISRKGETLLITNSHVCEAVEKHPYGLKLDGKIIEGTIVSKYEKHDLCAIKPFLTQPVKTLSIAAKSPSVDDVVYTTGHPALRPLTITKGRYIGDEIIQLPKFDYTVCNGIEQILPPLARFFTGRDKVCLQLFHSYQTTNIIFGGNSGSPLLNDRAEIVGVVFAGSNQVTDSYSVPLVYLQEFLKTL